MASNVKQIGVNAIENGVEDYTSMIIFERMREYTKPFLKEYEGEGAFNEAMTSFFNTLSIGLAIYANNQVYSFFFDRGIKLTASMWTYIVAGSLKQRVLKRFKNYKGRGKSVIKKASLILGADRTAERVEVAKMMQNQVNSFDNNKFHYQTQSDAMHNRLDNFSGSMAHFKSSYDVSAVDLMVQKTFMGSWTSSLEDKKLYEKATRKKLNSSGQGSWNNVYQELNKHTSFGKTSNDEVMNLTQALLKVLARNGALS